MQYTTLMASAAALFAAHVQADGSVGTATIVNNCGRPVFYKICFNGYDSDVTALQHGQTFSEPYRWAQGAGGASMKLGFDEKRPDYIAQFEYTVDKATSQWNPAPSVFYDISFVNGAPFQSYGVQLAPSDEQCPKSTCPAGKTCPADQAYSAWNDDLSSKKCNLQSSLTLTLCTEMQPPATGVVPDGGAGHLGPIQYRSIAERAAAATPAAPVVGHGHAMHHAHHRRHFIVRPFSA